MGIAIANDIAEIVLTNCRSIHLHSHLTDDSRRLTTTTKMATLEQHNMNRENRLHNLRLLVVIPILLILTAGYFYYTFRYIVFLHSLYPEIIFLYLPFSVLLLWLTGLFLPSRDYSGYLKFLLTAVFLLSLGWITFHFMQTYYYKFVHRDYYAGTFLLTGLIFRYFPQLYSVRRWIIIIGASAGLGIAVTIILCYHVFLFDFILVHPKDHLSFKKTLITLDDLKTIITDYNTKSGMELVALNSDPLIQLMRQRGILVMNPNVKPPDQFSDDFKRKHMDALVRIYDKEEIAGKFFPSGFYNYKKSVVINDFFLKDIQIKFNRELGYEYEVRLLFQKYDRSRFFEVTSTDIDTAMNTFRAPVDNSTLGKFDVLGEYVFEKTPYEQKPGVIVLKAKYSTALYGTTMEFTLFRPHFNNQ
ncbi:MAG: hypothetical protein V4687_01095 [Bacteroidota bacterium]